MPTDPATDRENLLDLQRGEAAALDKLIARWQRPLLSFAHRYVQNSADAQDLVAETFVRLYQKRANLRPDTNLPAWLFTALSNRCHNLHRWRQRHPTVALGASTEWGPVGRLPETGQDPVSDGDSPVDALARDEAFLALKAAVDALPHDLKVAVLLHHYEHLPYREIAFVSGCSERGVETRLYRARQLLRRDLAAFLGEASGS